MDAGTLSGLLQFIGLTIIVISVGTLWGGAAAFLTVGCIIVLLGGEIGRRG